MEPSDTPSRHTLPSEFFTQHIEQLRRAARIGPVVDLACGRGRHTIAGARAGVPMVGIDRNLSFLTELQSIARAERVAVDVVRADLEAASGCPLAPGSCGAILVFRYLHRPLAPTLCEALAPGGLLLYETFSIDQIEIGWGPSNPAFLLRHGELPQLFRGLEILEQWEGTLPGSPGGPRPEAVGRLFARRP